MMMDLPPNPTQNDLEQQLMVQTILLDALDSEDEEYIQKRAGMESNIEYLNRSLGIDDETMSQAAMISPGTMSQGNMSQESWEQMPLQTFEDTSNQFGGNQFGYTDMNGMATNTNGASGNDFNWILDNMYPGECVLFSLIVLIASRTCGVEALKFTSPRSGWRISRHDHSEFWCASIVV